MIIAPPKTHDTCSGAEKVAYFQQDKRRDPTGERTRWIVQQLLRGGKTASQLMDNSEANGLGYARLTYSKDLTGLKNKGMVYSERGVYHLDVFGARWAAANGIDKGY